MMVPPSMFRFWFGMMETGLSKRTSFIEMLKMPNMVHAAGNHVIGRPHGKPFRVHSGAGTHYHACGFEVVLNDGVGGEGG